MPNAIQRKQAAMQNALQCLGMDNQQNQLIQALQLDPPTCQQCGCMLMVDQANARIETVENTTGKAARITYPAGCPHCRTRSAVVTNVAATVTVVAMPGNALPVNQQPRRIATQAMTRRTANPLDY